MSSAAAAATQRSIALVAGASALVWLPNLLRPLSPDEGGYLLVASQWSPGTSLYGNYWVDRPPLLNGLFQLVDLLGDRVALRLLGLAAVVGFVLLAARLGRLAAPGARHAPILCAAVAAVFMTTPLFGATEVDGELLAVPWVLLSIYASLEGTQSAGRGPALGRRGSSSAWAALAGGAAVAGLLVKQSMADGFVLAVVVTASLVRHRRPRLATRYLACFGVGAAAVLGLALTWASLRGTSASGLWDAVVVFRADAAAVISSRANEATPHRAVGLASAFLASGALVLVGAAFLPRRRDAGRPRGDDGSRTGGAADVRVAAVAVLAWELVAVVSGGSYWLHYLIGTVPGLVLVTAAATLHHPARQRWLLAGLTYAALVAVVGAVVAFPRGGDAAGDAVAAYIAARARPGDTAVVAFGDPAILQDAHLQSPYPELWSLPVRVRDPRLRGFDRVLTGPERPTWVVVNGATLATWGVDASRAQPILDRDYRMVDDVDDEFGIYRLRARAEPGGARRSGRWQGSAPMLPP